MEHSLQCEAIAAIPPAPKRHQHQPCASLNSGSLLQSKEAKHMVRPNGRKTKKSRAGCPDQSNAPPRGFLPSRLAKGQPPQVALKRLLGAHSWPKARPCTPRWCHHTVDSFVREVLQHPQPCSCQSGLAEMIPRPLLSTDPQHWVGFLFSCSFF